MKGYSFPYYVSRDPEMRQGGFLPQEQVQTLCPCFSLCQSWERTQIPAHLSSGLQHRDATNL